MAALSSGAADCIVIYVTRLCRNAHLLICFVWLICFLSLLIMILRVSAVHIPHQIHAYISCDTVPPTYLIFKLHDDLP